MGFVSSFVLHDMLSHVYGWWSLVFLVRFGDIIVVMFQTMKVDSDGSAFYVLFPVHAF